MKDTNIINSQFKNKNMKIVWNKLKINKKLKVKSNLNADDFKCHFDSINMEGSPLTMEQINIQKAVEERTFQ